MFSADLLPAVIAAAPQYALTGYLIYLLHGSWSTRRADAGDYRADLDAAEKRHSAEIERVRAAHEADLANLRASLVYMQEQLVSVTTQLDAERRARWRAEDIAADARRLATAGVDLDATPTGSEG